MSGEGGGAELVCNSAAHGVWTSQAAALHRKAALLRFLLRPGKWRQYAEKTRGQTSKERRDWSIHKDAVREKAPEDNCS
jgi:hypothetical protein